MLGLLGTTAFCTLGCMCQESRLFHSRVLKRTHRIGLSLAPIDDASAPQLGERTCTWRFGGDRYNVARVQGFRRGIADTLGGLLDFVADLQHPIVQGECTTRGVAHVGRGAAAYAAWETAMIGCQRLSSSRREAIMRHATSWSSMRLLASRFLISIAGARRTAWARSLRMAGSLAADEANMLHDALIGGQATIRVAGVVEVIREASSLARRIHGLAAWAALTGAGLDEPVTSELLRADGEPPDPRTVGSLIYLARAGSAPFRRLALARLARSSEPQALATIRESANDGDSDVADVARWAMAERAA